MTDTAAPPWARADTAPATRVTEDAAEPRLAPA
jgi:hypothetical protein